MRTCKTCAKPTERLTLGPGLLAHHYAGPSGDASSETGPRPERPGRDAIIARVALAQGRISQSDRLIVELVDTGSMPVVILIRPQLSIARKRAGASFLIMTRLPLPSLTGLS